MKHSAENSSQHQPAIQVILSKKSNPFSFPGQIPMLRHVPLHLMQTQKVPFAAYMRCTSLSTPM